MTNEPIAERLRDLLEAERQALLSGDFERMAALYDEKATLAGRLSDLPERAEVIEPLQTGLRRNHELFEHALAGLRNVVTRLGSLQQIRKSLDTYDAQGRRTTITEPQAGKLERRA